MSLGVLANQLSDKDYILQKEYGLKIKGDWGKGTYPYQWVDSVEKFEATSFPKLEDFKNALAPLPCAEDYKNAKTFFTKYCKTFKDYHLYYLKTDVLILADALKTFNDELFAITHLYITRAQSLPQMSFAAMLLEHGKEIPLITDPVQYDKCKDACKGGINVVGKRVTEVKNTLKERLIHFDMKSMCPDAMMNSPPCGNYKWIEEPTCKMLIELANSF